MGYKDNREPYRRHLTRKTREDLVEEVKKLEKQRDAGSASQPGKPWTVEKWLQHWVENIAKPTVSENTYDGYEVAVRVHLVPGIGKHRLDRLQPEHLESLYRCMQANGRRKAGTAHQAHRTARTALGEAATDGRGRIRGRALLRRRGAVPVARSQQAPEQRPLDAGAGARVAAGRDARTALV